MLNDLGIISSSLSREGEATEHMRSTLEKTCEDLAASIKEAVSIEEQSKALLVTQPEVPPPTA